MVRFISIIKRCQDLGNNIKQSHIGEFESGVQNPSLDKLEVIAKALYMEWVLKELMIDLEHLQDIHPRHKKAKSLQKLSGGSYVRRGGRIRNRDPVTDLFVSI